MNESPGGSLRAISRCTHPIRQSLHSVHDGTVEAVGGLDNEDDTKPAIQLSEVLVLVPWLIQQLLYIDGGISPFSTNDNLVLWRHLDLEEGV